MSNIGLPVQSPPLNETALRPKVLNYQVNDICNARCVMCMIWQKQRGAELSPEKFSEILRDPFFSEVEHIGITGGEPTLRPDLDRFYIAALDAIPLLKGGYFITNGFSPTRCLNVYGRVNDIYRETGRVFAGMVSIDGVGQTHDLVRGKQGSFKRAERSLFALRDAGIDATACCTIVKSNVYDLEDLLEWALRRGVYVRFRVGEFIRRLYNADAVDEIRAFDPAQIKHLISFFYRLLLEYEPADHVKRTYKSILSLLTGGERLVRCPYQRPDALNIDCRGRIAVCAPQGELRAWTNSPTEVDKQLRLDRERIVRDQCHSCIHDYHDEWSAETVSRIQIGAAEFDDLFSQPVDSGRKDWGATTFDPTRCKNLMLVGWYGTETAGDIAILGGILMELLEVNPELTFTLISLFPEYTRVTLADLPIHLTSRLLLIGRSEPGLAQAVERADAIVMAGGPLMDIDETHLIASSFLRFRAAGKAAVVYACGVGPLREERYRAVVEAIFRRASAVTLRDQASADLARSWGIDKPIVVREDPAVRYVRETGLKASCRRNPIIRCFLRELTWHYRQETTPEEAEEKLAALIRRLLDANPSHNVELWSMHYFHVGHDDRLFARRLATRVADKRLSMIQEPTSPNDILRAMADADLCVCMRFHSVVFAHTIGAPFVAIDYTDGGKIRSYLQHVGSADRCFMLSDLDSVPVQLGVLNYPASAPASAP